MWERGVLKLQRGVHKIAVLIPPDRNSWHKYGTPMSLHREESTTVSGPPYIPDSIISICLALKLQVS